MNGAPLRRVLHASTAALAFLPQVISWSDARLVLGALAIAAVLFELLRLSIPGFGRWLAAFLPVFRAAEAGRPSGGLWLAVGYAGAAWLPDATPMSAAAGIAVAALADPAAAAAGSWLARGPGKSWAGTLAAAAVAYLVLALLGLPVQTTVVAAVAAAVVERVPPPLDDNLFIAPTVTGIVILLA